MWLFVLSFPSVQSEMSVKSGRIQSMGLGYHAHAATLMAAARCHYLDLTHWAFSGSVRSLQPLALTLVFEAVEDRKAAS